MYYRNKIEDSFRFIHFPYHAKCTGIYTARIRIFAFTGVIVMGIMSSFTGPMIQGVSTAFMVAAGMALFALILSFLIKPMKMPKEDEATEKRQLTSQKRELEV